MIPLRSISAKLILAITVAVLLPFLGFSYFVHSEMGDRLSRDVVLYFLKSKASDLADKINLFLTERQKDLRIWVEDPAAKRALLESAQSEAKQDLEKLLNHFCQQKQVYDLLLIADLNGKVVASNTMDRYETFFSPQYLSVVFEKNVQQEKWFQDAAAGKFSQIDWHISPLIHDSAEQASNDPRIYGVGFAGPIRHPDSGKVIGVWYNLVNWSFIQVDILDKVKKYFSSLQTPEAYQSGYAWLWREDGDSIIAHQNRGLYGKKLSEEPVHLPQLKEAVLKESWGIFPEYEYPPGVWKSSAFRWTRTPAEGGFGWIVGIGINNSDILATVTELRQVLLTATVLILAGIITWTWIISRTITAPVKSLISFTKEVAKGNLDARVEKHTDDELGILADSFNRMTADLAASREKLIRAEKEEAWREMARQIAHEIKNPLTPMQLSMTLLQKAHKDRSPEFSKIFDQTSETILRQIEALKRIASDFSAFAGVPQRRPEKLDLLPVLEDCLSLYRAWAQEKNIALIAEGEGGAVFADREEIRRLFINLIDNALEAVEKDGELKIISKRDEVFLQFDFTDTGPGVAPEIQARLFEPYFSTKTTGTGLGLAICRRIVTDLGGTIEMHSAPGKGTTVRLRLPLHP